MKEINTIGILFVCLGNICRSPAAEGTFRHIVNAKKLSHLFHIDSAGTAAYHIGEGPNSRTRGVAEKRGIRLEHSARQFTREDFSRFDLILTMDDLNHRDVLSIKSTVEDAKRVMKFRAFDPDTAISGHIPDVPDVPDPYFGGPEGFEHVQDIMDRTSAALLEWILSNNSRMG